ncbi:MAG TPA: hypothetical protein VMU69_04285 [Bradyrhizobium sp.]|nr:hypothetical protein [Bradyrhizobium sp.]
MGESNVDRFLNEVEECLRQAGMATNSLDRKAWLELAEEWLELARAAKERDA